MTSAQQVQALKAKQLLAEQERLAQQGPVPPETQQSMPPEQLPPAPMPMQAEAPPTQDMGPPPRLPPEAPAQNASPISLQDIAPAPAPKEFSKAPEYSPDDKVGSAYLQKTIQKAGAAANDLEKAQREEMEALNQKAHVEQQLHAQVHGSVDPKTGKITKGLLDIQREEAEAAEKNRIEALHAAQAQYVDLMKKADEIESRTPAGFMDRDTPTWQKVLAGIGIALTSVATRNTGIDTFVMPLIEKAVSRQMIQEEQMVNRLKNKSARALSYMEVLKQVGATEEEARKLTQMRILANLQDKTNNLAITANNASAQAKLAGLSQALGDERIKVANTLLKDKVGNEVAQAAQNENKRHNLATEAQAQKAHDLAVQKTKAEIDKIKNYVPGVGKYHTEPLLNKGQALFINYETARKQIDKLVDMLETSKGRREYFSKDAGELQSLIKTITAKEFRALFGEEAMQQHEQELINATQGGAQDPVLFADRILGALSNVSSVLYDQMENTLEKSVDGYDRTRGSIVKQPKLMQQAARKQVAAEYAMPEGSGD